MHHVPRAGRFVRELAAITALGFALAACDRVPAPEPTIATDPTSLATAWSTSTTPSAAAASMPTTTRTSSITIPAKAQENSAIDAMEFVEFLVSEVNRAHAEADPNSLEAYFTTDCIGCKGLLDHAKGTASGGPRTDNEIWLIEEQECVNLTTDTAEVALFIWQIDADQIGDLGVTVDTIDATPEEFYIVLSWESGSWTVSEWLKVEE